MKPSGKIKLPGLIIEGDTYENIFKDGVNDESFEKATRLFDHNLAIEEFRREWFKCYNQTGLIIRDPFQENQKS